MSVQQDTEDYLREIRRRRFAGEEVVMSLAPREPRGRWLAKLIAAERAGAQVEVDGVRFNPQEDLAWTAWDEAVQSLCRRAYRAAWVRLSEAAYRTYDPLLAQRVALWRLLAAASRNASYTDPHEKLNIEPYTALYSLLPKLDALPDLEREHYMVETDRLRSLHGRAAASQPYALVWTLARAELASSTDEPDATLLWCLRAHSEAGGAETASDYLVSLVERARSRLQALTGDIVDEDESVGSREGAKLYPREFLAALIEHAERVAGFDPRPVINEYAPLQYLDAGS